MRVLLEDIMKYRFTSHSEMFLDVCSVEQRKDRIILRDSLGWSRTFYLDPEKEDVTIIVKGCVE